VMDTVVSVATGIDEFEFSGNICTNAQITFYINKADASPVGGAASGIGNTRIYGNRFEKGNGILFETITTGTDTYLTSAPYVPTDAGATAGPIIPIASKQILIKGNHFGSALTNGDEKYAIFFHGLDSAVDVRESDIFIQYNNFQYPQTGTVGPTVTLQDAHVAWVGKDTAVAIDARFNWWGSTNGPIGAFASCSNAVVKAIFTSSSYIS